MITEITTYNLIKEQIEVEKRLNEGLIMTHDIHISKNIILDFFKNFELRDITIKDNNTISITTKVLDLEIFTGFLTLINNLGYFISYMYFWKSTENNPTKISLKSFKEYYFDDEKLKNINRLDFKIEAKYDITRKLNTNILYHVTENRYLDKILKIGIKPNSNNTLFDYPDRVYCSYNLEDAIKYKNSKSGYYLKTNKDDKTNIKNNYAKLEFTVLKITLPLNNNFIFYDDPNYLGKGIYTYNDIKPEYIEVNENDL